MKGPKKGLKEPKNDKNDIFNCFTFYKFIILRIFSPISNRILMGMAIIHKLIFKHYSTKIIGEGKTYIGGTNNPNEKKHLSSDINTFFI